MLLPRIIIWPLLLFSSIPHSLIGKSPRYTLIPQIQEANCDMKKEGAARKWSVGKNRLLIIIPDGASKIIVVIVVY